MVTKTKKKTDLPSYLTSQEVARRLQLKNGTLQNWRSQGKGPRWHKLERRVLYKAEEVQDWIDGLHKSVFL